jgi:hypothetical protein
VAAEVEVVEAAGVEAAEVVVEEGEAVAAEGEAVAAEVAVR